MLDKMKYTKRQLAWLKTWYRHYRIPELTRRFNKRFKVKKSECAIKSACSNCGFLSGRPCGNLVGTYRLLTKWQAGYIRKTIKKHTHAEVAGMLNRKYGIRITAGQLHSFTANHKISSGRTGCFPKGHVSWNTGTKGMGICKGNSGNFKKGHVPANRRPLGFERIDSKDGYVLVKVRERNPYTGHPTRFKPKHHIVWERHHGPIPKGMIIIFKDGNKLNFRISNLACITKNENVRLNQMHYGKYPKKLKPSVFALAKLKARIGEIRRAHEKTV
jgi:hypothetical protein